MFITANKFYETNKAKQLEIISGYIANAMTTGNPVIKLPFDIYPDVEIELESKGWVYERCDCNNIDEAYAVIYPEQYVEDDDNEDIF